MTYQVLRPANFFAAIRSEAQARAWLWRSKYGGADFHCPHCGHSEYVELRTRPEVRMCSGCRRQIRLRVNTICQRSKVPILVWLRTIFLMMQDKRGASVLSLKRELGLKSYGTMWGLMHKIRRALGQRDERYKLKGYIELDGANFRRQTRSKPTPVIVAIETKDWVDDKGRPKSRAGFAKVLMGTESQSRTQTLINRGVEPGAFVNTDGALGFRTLKGVDADHQFVGQDQVVIDRWLPWVHKFISNAKTWLMGTHHGVGPDYFPLYLSEYTYRFNRRHDPDSLFHRALVACALATPVTLSALTG